MGANSKIEWTTHTHNPWRGCAKVSPGCANCYAEAGARRNPAVLGEWGVHGTRVLASEAKWAEPLAWDREAARTPHSRPRVFCASIADVFEAWCGQLVDAKRRPLWVDPRDPRREARVCESKAGSFLPHDCFEPMTLADARLRLLDTIRRTPHLDWLLVTKRPENVLPALQAAARVVPGGVDAYDETIAWIVDWIIGKPPANVWLGTSVEDQARADERIPHLLKAPARVRFLSCEPLLGPVDISPWLRCGECKGKAWDRVDVHEIPCPLCGGDFEGVDWVIVGGESGHGARPMHPAWARSLRDQCQAAGVAFFMKQMTKKEPIPDDLMIREFPNASR